MDITGIIWPVISIGGMGVLFGAGLGLALTAMILKRHSMVLSVESEVGYGTRISIFTI